MEKSIYLYKYMSAPTPFDTELKKLCEDNAKIASEFNSSMENNRTKALQIMNSLRTFYAKYTGDLDKINRGSGGKLILPRSGFFDERGDVYVDKVANYSKAFCEYLAKHKNGEPDKKEPKKDEPIPKKDEPKKDELPFVTKVEFYLEKLYTGPLRNCTREEFETIVKEIKDFQLKNPEVNDEANLIMMYLGIPIPAYDMGYIRDNVPKEYFNLSGFVTEELKREFYDIARKNNIVVVLRKKCRAVIVSKIRMRTKLGHICTGPIMDGTLGKYCNTRPFKNSFGISVDWDYI